MGTFIIRLSERLDGEFVVSYNHQTGGVRHYLIQPDDISDKKRTLVDFLGQNKMFVHILQVSVRMKPIDSQMAIVPGGIVWQKHDKDKILEKHYKRPVNKQTKVPNVGNNPYDMILPA